MTLNNEKNWTIIQISDTHLMDQDHLEFVRMNPEQSFHHVMQHIVERHPQIDAFVHTGRLGTSTCASNLSTLFRLYAEFKDAVLSGSGQS